MKFSIGDIVLLKRTGEEGRVVDFVNKDMIEVEVGGTHFPVFLDEVDHPYLKWFTDKKKDRPATIRHIDEVPVEAQAKGIGHGVASGFHLSFLPVFRFDEYEDVVDKLKAYFINQTPHQLTLQYECLGQSGAIFRHKAELRPFSHFYLHDIPFAAMQEQPRFLWILEQQLSRLHAGSLSNTLRIKPKKLFEYIHHIQQANKPMFHIQLAEDFPLPAATLPQPELKESVGSIVTALKAGKKEKPRTEIDLHIEALVADTRGLSNFEMLTIQMEAFGDALDEAMRNHQQSLVVIHGVGKGRLKEEIHQVLRETAAVDFFQHDWNPRYGYGATEIFFRH
ncbi:Smr/MutS family protein [Taibaiella koreensis]|uniref:Smr/MutS family protein n=1 Tax=Taibaiella koreensis TaxID=1268548 RepID=UPI000E59F8BA|nr:Smr/MutS family protein [Taibaiella koreensis]